jgi:hypothetical protein
LALLKRPGALVGMALLDDRAPCPLMDRADRRLRPCPDHAVASLGTGCGRSASGAGQPHWPVNTN